MGHASKIIAAACDALAETFWPTRCAGCDLSGVLLCEDCRAQLELIDPLLACPRCGAPYGSLACTECEPPGALDREGRLLPLRFAFATAKAACSYEGVAARMLRLYKDAGEQRLAPLIAGCIADALKSPGASWEGWADAIAAVPPNPRNMRRRGFDHLAPVADELSKELGLPAVGGLASLGAADQRALGRAERAQNRAGSFAVADGVFVPPRVLLIDDVLTTGATADDAAKALLAAGAAEVRVAVFARVW